MAYYPEYEADFRCPKGHEFTARVNRNGVHCPTCWNEWVAANVPLAEQISEERQVDIWSAPLAKEEG
jgi:hypothetical protein